MAKDDGKDEKKSGGGVMMKIVIAVVLSLVLAGGGAYGAYAAGLFGGNDDSGPDEPKLVKKGDDDPYAMPAQGGGKDDTEIIHGEGGSEYRTAYYSFADPFTSNLSGSPALVQTELAVSTQRDGRVLQWVNTHELAIRSAILAQLAATTEAELYDLEGKKQLTKRLTDAINAVLEENEGFGGVEAVHFKGLLVQ